MNIDKFEVWVHDNLLKRADFRHKLHRIYQRTLLLCSPKFSSEGNITRVTPDDGFEYLFGYYDKCPWSPDGKYMLALRVKDAFSEPDSVQCAQIARISLEDRSVDLLAETHTWNVQQGCMLRWLGNESIIYNDIRDGKYVAVILNIIRHEEKLLDMPVYTVSNDETTALSLDFSRLHRLRPGYGYANLPDEHANEKCPDAPCIWKIDIGTNKITPILTYTRLAAFEPKENMLDAEFKVNHLMLSPDGSRFMLLFRWFKDGNKYTRLLTCNVDGSDLYNLSDDDFVSHCCWKNDHEIISYLNKTGSGKGYYLLKDKTHDYSRMWPSLITDGHPSVSPDGVKVVTDTYPNRQRIQTVYVMSGDSVTSTARVFSSLKYSGDNRCDLHPRWNANGTEICFDACFEGKRAVYIVK